MTIPTWWTPERVEALETMFRSNLPYREIAQRLGTSKLSVGQKLSRMGYQRRHGGQEMQWSDEYNGGQEMQWSDEYTAYLKQRLGEKASAGKIAKELNISRNAVIGKIARLRREEFKEGQKMSEQVATPVKRALSGRILRRFTSEEDKIITEMWKAYVRVEEIARRLNRDWGTVRQRILHLGLRRSGRAARAMRHAPDHLKAVLEREGPEAFLKAMEEHSAREQAALVMAQAEEREKLLAARAEKVTAINAEAWTRREKMYALRTIGLTLEEIGQMYHITRERVRQITTIGYVPYETRQRAKARSGGEEMGKPGRPPIVSNPGVALSHLQAQITELQRQEKTLREEAVDNLFNKVMALPPDLRQTLWNALKREMEREASVESFHVLPRHETE